MKFVQFNLISGQQEGEDDAVITTTTPVMINVEQIRSFSRRKAGYNNAPPPPGTRIAFVNSAALIVNETYDVVTALVSPTLN